MILFLLSAGVAVGAAIDGGDSVTVPGTYSSPWNVGEGLAVGETTTGSLTIESGGSVTSTSGGIGLEVGSSGTVSISGAGSNWTASNFLTVGSRGSGELTISNGGLASSSAGVIGGYFGGTGSVLITGSGSSWASATSIYVGEGGQASLTVSDGASLSSETGNIGSSLTGSGSVLIQGKGTEWTNSSGLIIAVEGSGSLTILDGGRVSSGDAYIAYGGASNGAVEVRGNGSLWSIGSNLVAGFSGDATLRITDGGKVTVTNGAYFGYDTGSYGDGGVAGKGSRLEIGGDLRIGGDSGTVGVGSLYIRDGGVVSVGDGNGIVYLAQAAGSYGTLQIGSVFPMERAAQPGTLLASEVRFGDGQGELVIYHNSKNYSFDPILTGNGTVYHQGGTTRFTTNSPNFHGSFEVSGGHIIVDGSLEHTDINLQAGASLSGHGMIGRLAADGVIAPGNSIGTLNVAGDLAFYTSSTYEVEVDAAGKSDKIVAGGIAYLVGGKVKVLAGSGKYAPRTTYTILTAAGGVDGKFNAVSSNFAFLEPELAYYPYSVDLILNRNTLSFASIGKTRNQRATGRGLDSLDMGNAVWDAFIQLDAGQARQALDLLSGEVHASAKQALLEDSRFVRDAALDRLRDAFDGVAAVSTPVLAYAGDKKAVVAPASTTSDRYAVWGRGFGSWGRWDGDGNAASLTRDLGGFFLGGDTLIADAWRVGLLGGYSHSDFRVDARSSSGSSNDAHVGLYGGTEWGGFALRAGGAYAWHDLEFSRSVSFTGFSKSVNANYNAHTIQGFTELGYGIKTAAVELEPFGNLAYVHLFTDGFTEKGGAAALSGRSDGDGVTFTALGLRASGKIPFRNGTSLTARGSAAWRHAFGNVNPFSTLSFSGGSSFEIAGVPIAENTALVQAGFDFNFSQTTAVGVSYNGEFGSGIIDHGFNANVTVKF